MSPKRILFFVVVMSLMALAIGAGSQRTRPVQAISPDPIGDSIRTTVPYLGQLTDEAGEPVADGAYDLSFALYADEIGGRMLWTETQIGAQVQRSSFSIMLGSVNSIPKSALDGDQHWLEVGVRGPGDTDFTTLAPRQRLSATSPASPAAGPTCAHDHWGETWSGSSTGLQLINAASQRAVLLFTTWAGTIGVYGNGDIGVEGDSTNGTGVVANGKDTSGADSGDLALGGDYGEIVASGEQLNLYSGGNASVYLDTNANSNSQFEIWSTNTFPGVILTVKENGDLWAAGTKSAVVETASHGQRLLYAIESPEVWFEDVGSATLTNGEAIVTFEPIFAETVNLATDYHVFVTPLCQVPALLFVTSKTTTDFTVRGVTPDGQPSKCAFDYRIAAKRLGYDSVRLESVAGSTGDNGKPEVQP